MKGETLNHDHRLEEIASIQTTVEGAVYRCTQCPFTNTVRSPATAILDPLEGIPDDDRMLRFRDFEQMMTARG
jgi:hypothetical protein